MRRMSPLGVFACVLIAGCLGGKAPPQQEDPPQVPVPDTLRALKEILELHFDMADAIQLHGTVYLPDVPEGTKVPTIMDLGPYYGNLGPETYVHNAESPPSLLYHYFLQHGYAIALVSLRGTGQSEGCFTIGGPQEEADAAAIVEQLAAQPWSNGAVALTGVSYDGTTPWEAAVTGTPSLKAIIPVEGISDHYRYPFYDGVPVGGGELFNTYYLALVDAAYTDMDGLEAWAAAQATNVCPETAQVVAQGYLTYADGVHGAYWDARDMNARVDQIKAATFVVHGLQDWNVKPDNVQDIWSRLAEPKRMLLGQWEHNIPWRNTYNDDWSYEAYNATMEQWLDAFLLNDTAAREAALAAPPVVVQDSTGHWWNLTAWPPEESADVEFHLQPDGTVTNQAATESGTASFRTASAVPLGPLGPDRVAFATAPLEGPLMLMGNPTITLTLSVDQPGGYLAVILYDEAPNGNQDRVVPGWLNLAQRESRDSSADVPINTAMEVTVQLEALAHLFEKDHKLVVELRGDDVEMAAPQFAPQWTIHLGPGDSNVLRAPVFTPTDAAPSM